MHQIAKTKCNIQRCIKYAVYVHWNEMHNMLGCFYYYVARFSESHVTYMFYIVCIVSITMLVDLIWIYRFIYDVSRSNTALYYVLIYLLVRDISIY